MKRTIGLLLVMSTTACWESNPAFAGDSGSTTDPVATDTTRGATNGGSSGGTTSGSSGETTGQPPGTSESGTSSVSSTSGGGEPTYPPCMEGGSPECPPPYSECYGFVGPDHSVCTQDCETVDDCPQPTSGTTPVVCVGAPVSQCVLECDGAAICPDGMDCLGVGPGGMFNRCAWPS